MIDILHLSKAVRHKRRYDAVITVEDPGIRAIKRLRYRNAPHPDHLVLRFEDIDDADDGIAGPHLPHVEAAIAFARMHRHGRMMVHCHAGISRSAALGLAIMADRLGEGAESHAVEALLAGVPDAVPNLIVLDMADAVLGRGGALVAAWNLSAETSPYVTGERVKKRKLVEEKRHLFHPAPSAGHYQAMRFRPDTRLPSAFDTSASGLPVFTSSVQTTAGRPDRNR